MQIRVGDVAGIVCQALLRGGGIAVDDVVFASLGALTKAVRITFEPAAGGGRGGWKDVMFKGTRLAVYKQEYVTEEAAAAAAAAGAAAAAAVRAGSGAEAGTGAEAGAGAAAELEEGPVEMDDAYLNEPSKADSFAAWVARSRQRRKSLGDEPDKSEDNVGWLQYQKQKSVASAAASAAAAAATAATAAATAAAATAATAAAAAAAAEATAASEASRAEAAAAAFREAAEAGAYTRSLFSST